MSKSYAGKTVPLRYAGLLLFTCALLLLVVIGCRKHGDDDMHGTGNVTPALQLMADGLVSPLGVIESPDFSKRLFVIDQAGKVWIIKNGQKLNEPFIDLTGKIVQLQAQYDERGLLGLAFHPNYKSNGKFYIFYTAPPRPGGPAPGVNWNSLTRISEFRVSSNPDKADMGSEKVILEADHPQLNHNGGTLAFGPDGYLYISIGDGGAADDNAPGHVDDWYKVNKGGNAQNIYANLMGKVLRIDVNNGSPYSIPSDNPFANGNALGEIWAYGLRNPYRFSFDMEGTHQLYLGDAGQSLYEEIDIIERGGNYGWNVKEGTVCFNTDSDKLTRTTCPVTDSMGNPLREPWLQLKNAANPEGGVATVVIGGNVYRGDALPALKGRYVFGIYSQSAALADAKLFIANQGGSGYEPLDLQGYAGNLGMYLKGFGQDASGELYITTSAQAGVNGTTGKVYKLVGK